MISFPNAKINLGLKVLRKRDDGYHDLETIFYPIPYHDILEIVENQSNFESGSSVKSGGAIVNNAITLTSGFKAHFSFSGLEIPGHLTNNLCVKALKLFDERSPLKSNVSIHLHKIIPSGAGLGGGSSDAAFTLKMLNELSGFSVKPDELNSMAAKLGSDCAFFLLNKPAYATGRGEILEPIEISLKGKYILLVKPTCNVGTQEAFSGIKPNESGERIADYISKPFNEMKKVLVNDFEETVFKLYPEISQIKKQIENAGAVYTSMSGSGSSVFGVFENDPGEINFEKEFTVFKTQLL